MVFLLNTDVLSDHKIRTREELHSALRAYAHQTLELQNLATWVQSHADIAAMLDTEPRAVTVDGVLWLITRYGIYSPKIYHGKHKFELWLPYFRHAELLIQALRQSPFAHAVYEITPGLCVELTDAAPIVTCSVQNPVTQKYLGILSKLPCLINYAQTSLYVGCYGCYYEPCDEYIRKKARTGEFIATTDLSERYRLK